MGTFVKQKVEHKFREAEENPILYNLRERKGGWEQNASKAIKTFWLLCYVTIDLYIELNEIFKYLNLDGKREGES